jgi:nucleoside-diphosphate-sugar epimerase
MGYTTALVTGSDGFIGTELCKQLLENGVSARGFSLNASGKSDFRGD